jgi:hypothetical protein
MCCKAPPRRCDRLDRSCDGTGQCYSRGDISNPKSSSCACVDIFDMHSACIISRRSWQSGTCMWITLRFGAGSSAMRRNSVGAVGANCAERTDPGVSTRRIFVLRASGPSLYRAVDSAGDTIDFLLSPKRDAGAAKRFFQKALQSTNHPRPRGINVDGNAACPSAIEESKRTRQLGRRCRCRPVRYLNNVVEQDHRAIKRRVRAMQGFRAFHSAWRTIQGFETMNMIRKGQIRWLPKDDILRQAAFIAGLFRVALAT